MPNINKRLGIGATVTVYARFLHPSRDIQAFYGENGFDKRKVENCIVIGRDYKRINQRNNVNVVLLRHDDFPNKVIYAATTIVKLTKPGDASHYFVTPSEPAAEPTTNQTYPSEEELRPTNVPANSQLSQEDVDRLRQEGFEVDDDNQPADDNIQREPVNPEEVQWSDWGFQGIDLRHEHSQQFNHTPNIPGSELEAEFNLFWRFFPKKFMVEVVLPATNKHLMKELKIGELTRWLGLIFLMSTIEGCHRRDFWSEKRD
jgi:hypothetical protein